MSRFSLTQKQHTVLDFIQSYFQANHCSPLIREIQSGCQIVSYKSALDRLNALERKGFIKRIPSKHRGIRIIKKALLPQPENQEVLQEAVAKSSDTASGIGVTDEGLMQ